MKATSLLLTALVGLTGALSSVLAGSTAGADYTAHEWGTFTSVQGSDGRLIAWNPFLKTDLPKFVYTRQKPFRGEEFANLKPMPNIFGKETMHWRQRMETPVIYFHSSKPLDVSATVLFPKGVISEWYPQAHAFGPIVGVKSVVPDSERSFIRWDNVRIEAAVKSGKADSRLPVETPAKASDEQSHYFHARKASANPLVARSPLMSAQERKAGQAEKFLFYRGAGNFETPLRTTFDEQGRLVLENTGPKPLTGLQVLEARGDAGQLQGIDALQPGQRLVVTIPIPFAGTSRNAVSATLRAGLLKSLEAAGLFGSEAEAMVSTWEHDWFGDDGLRVLYLLPQAWTDETLPLTLTPSPKQLVRVMVGRAELLTPAVEKEMRQLFTQAREGKGRAASKELNRLVAGRFLEPALTRLTTMERNDWLKREGLTLETAQENPRFKEAERQLANDIESFRVLLCGEPENRGSQIVSR